MQAVKLCSNQILQSSFTWECQLMQVVLYNAHRMVVVVVVVFFPLPLYIIVLEEKVWGLVAQIRYQPLPINQPTTQPANWPATQPASQPAN